MEENRRQLLLGTLIGVAVAAPILGMMGFIFLASVTLLLVVSPLLLLVSPILIIAGFILAATLTAFSVAGAMAVAGVWALKWAVCGVRDQGLVQLKGREWAEKLKAQLKGREWAEKLKAQLDGTEWVEKLKAVTGLRSDENGEVEVEY